ncbi:MAG TPA: sigma-70 family RNA polymerase sigma factor [Isosphaeraceae bacterium]|jgi:RNA polymerase sigma-70 factor (ECF subfamily)|nr:sigma-70 family RNA polymerase sigma factor [Isosphaeraceae bacterium]
MAVGGSGAVLQGFRTLFGAGAVGALTDAQLVERFAHGRDPAAAFEAIVARHGPMVLGVCRRVLRDEHDADDAFQATFLVLARKAGGLGRPERLACWLYGVASRVALKARAGASRRRAREGPLAGIDAAAPEADRDDARDLRPILDAELARLPARHRAAIVLHDLEGRSVAETAAALGVAPGTVWSRLNRGRERLRSRLARRGLAFAAAPAAILSTRDASAALPTARLIEPTVLAATGRAAAGASPARAAALCRGVLRTMLLTKLSTAASAVALLGAGLALYRAEAASPRPAAAPNPVAPRDDKAKEGDKEKAAKADAKKLQGTWRPTSSRENGRDQADFDKYRLIFKDESFTITKEGETILKGKFKLDPSKDPKTIDMEPTESKQKDDDVGKTAKGIYSFDGDMLKWCSSPPGEDGDRPTDFTSEEGTKRLLVVLEREAK